MEINYDLIIKHLVTKKIQFSSKKHILIYSELFPEKFKNILQNKFYRYGINQNNSFYNSILTLLNKKFITNNTEEEILEVDNFKKSLIKNLNDFDIPTYLSNIIDKKTVFDNINEKHIQVISEILSINFLIFDFKNEIINVVYTGIVCNPYKPTLLIANYEKFYEPIIYEYENKKIFSYNDIIIKKIYNAKLDIYSSLNKEFILQDTLNELLIDFDDNNYQVFTKEETDELEYTEITLNKMIKKDLENILNKKNIKYTSKMLKKDLIQLILK